MTQIALTIAAFLFLVFIGVVALGYICTFAAWGMDKWNLFKENRKKKIPLWK